jgi:hypothetical protein
MPWTVADTVLYQLLTAWLSSIAGYPPWTCDLYTNDHTPAPGDLASDYTLPTQDQWPGYASVIVYPGQWGRVSVTNHVAQTQYPTPAIFPLLSPIASLNIYGYLLTDVAGNLLWAEEFAQVQVVQQPGHLTLFLMFNEGVASAEDVSMAVDRGFRPDHTVSAEE